jgi:hypothetical protein
MKKINAYFATGSGLVKQTFEVDDHFDPELLVSVDYVKVAQVNRGHAMVQTRHVAFWTYD